MNYRYLAYCQAHGHTPEEQRQHDRESMIGFMLWINAQWRCFKQTHNVHADAPTGGSHQRFDRWLAMMLGGH